MTERSGNLSAGVFFLSRCQYDGVTDPGSGRIYYTDNWYSSQIKESGAYKLKDARSDKAVTLHSSEVKKISAREYKAAVTPEKAKHYATGVARGPAWDRR